MKIGSIIAIYFLFFAFSAFLLLPFGVRTSEEVGEAKMPGQADSAPHRFDLKRHLLRSARDRACVIRGLLRQLAFRLDHVGRSRLL